MLNYIIPYLQLRISPIGYGRKGYQRVGDFIDIRVPKMASYATVANDAIQVMQLEEEDEVAGEGEPSIFRIDRMVLPDSAINDFPWTISRYLKSLNKFPGQLKLGVGFYYGVSM